MIHETTKTAATYTQQGEISSRITIWPQATMIFFFSLPTLITVYNAQLTRMVADDYGYAIVAEREGLLGAVRYWYDTWTGNYSSSFLQSLATLIDPAALGWLMAITVLLLWLGTCWLAYEIATRLRWPHPQIIAPLGGGLVMATLIGGMPNIYDTLYWAAGGIAHVVPLVGVVFFVAFLSTFTRKATTRKTTSPRTTIAVTFLTVPYVLIFGGFSSPSTAHFIVLIVLLMLAYWHFADDRQRRTALPILTVALLTAFAALIIIGMAPGTDIRQARFPQPPGLPQLIGYTSLYTLGFASAEIALLAPISLLLTLILSGWAGYRFYPDNANIIRHYRWRLMGGILLVGTLLTAAPFSTGAYAMTTYLPHRANTTPIYTLIFTVGACGYVMGVTLRKNQQVSRRMPHLLIVAIITLMLLGPGNTLRNGFIQANNMHTFNQDWQAMHDALRTAANNGETTAEINAFRFDLSNAAVGLRMDASANDVTTRDLAKYYGLENITLR